jgi:uncharacterized cupin superfamily protein
VNLHDDRWDGEQTQAGYRWRSQRIAGEMIGATLYELPSGERTFPYHWHSGDEEWLLAVAGAPTLRHPDGERVLAPGDVVLLPSGPAGAHVLRNDGSEPARVLIASNLADAGVSVYPDSGKLGAWSPHRSFLTRESDTGVDYWEGEEAP